MLIQTLNVAKIVDQIKKLIPGNEKGVMLLVGEDSEVNIHDLINQLNTDNINFFGGIFPQIIYDNEAYANHILAIPVPLSGKPQLITGLGTGDIVVPPPEQPDEDEFYITFVDGLSSQIAKYLVTLYNVIGNGCYVIGGGAGSVSFQRKLCIFTADGLFRDAAVLACVKSRCNFGCGHGWSDLRGPFVATKTNANIIEELNWQKAIDVYGAEVEMDAMEKVSKENFSKLSQSYPFGIHKDDMEKIVRDPVGITENGGLVCVGEVPENSVLFLLKGDKNKLINAAGEVAENSVDIGAKPVKEVFVIDCVSRALFMAEDYKKELEQIKNKINNEQIITKGVLSLGEIASSGEGYLEFYNKTIIVGTFY